MYVRTYTATILGTAKVHCFSTIRRGLRKRRRTVASAAEPRCGLSSRAPHELLVLELLLYSDRHELRLHASVRQHGLSILVVLLQELSSVSQSSLYTTH